MRAAARLGKRVEDIEPARLALLNSGAIEASTLTECLAVDFATLMRAVLPDLSEEATARMQQAAGNGISRRMVLAARLISEHKGQGAIDELRQHSSDTVRGWGCFMIGAADNMTLSDRLAMIRPLADDHHFGVREWSWMAVRQHLVADLDNAIAQLARWTADSSERL